VDKVFIEEEELAVSRLPAGWHAAPRLAGPDHIDLGWTGTTNAAIADLDGDGKPEIVGPFSVRFSWKASISSPPR